MSDAPLTECPACGASTLKKLVSAAAFRLKGGGWYETDFKTGSKKMCRAAAAVVVPVGQAVAIVARAVQQVVGLAHHPTNGGCPFKFALTQGSPLIN